MSSEDKQSKQGESAAQQQGAQSKNEHIKDKLKEMGVMPSEEDNPNVDENKTKRRGGALILGAVVAVVIILVLWFSGDEETEHEMATDTQAPGMMGSGPAAGSYGPQGPSSFQGAPMYQGAPGGNYQGPSAFAPGGATDSSEGASGEGEHGTVQNAPMGGPGNTGAYGPGSRAYTRPYGYGPRPRPWARPPWAYGPSGQALAQQQSGEAGEQAPLSAGPRQSRPMRPYPPRRFYPAYPYYGGPAYYGHGPYYGPPPAYYGYRPPYGYPPRYDSPATDYRGGE